MNTTTHTIVIVGGGFAGIQAALKLKKSKCSNVKIIVINNKHNFEYYPGLYRVVMDHSPIEVCVPYELIFRNTGIEIVYTTIVSVDTVQKKIFGIHDEIYSYDSLILGLGSETNYFNLPGLDTLSFGFKSVKEALTLKNHIHDLFKEHDHPSQEELVSHFHVVIVGGGASGVELAGDLVSHLKIMAKFHGINPSLVTIDIIEASSRLLPALPESVSETALVRLRSLGVNVFLNRALIKEEIEQVYLKDMSMKSKTVIWTAGTKTNHLYGEIKNFEFGKGGRVIVDEYLQAKNCENVFIVGDGASTPYAGLAQTAIFDGRYVASVIEARLLGKTPKKYTPKKNSYAIPVGQGWGIVLLGDFLMMGRVAWWIRHIIDVRFFLSILPFSYVWKMYKKPDLNEAYCSVCAGCDTTE